MSICSGEEGRRQFLREGVNLVGKEVCMEYAYLMGGAHLFLRGKEGKIAEGFFEVLPWKLLLAGPDPGNDLLPEDKKACLLNI